MKRWLVAVVIALAFCVVDGLALIGVTRAFQPGKPPIWVTAPFFYVLAWPVPLLTHLFPQPAGSPDHGPSILAVGAAGLIDLALLVTLIRFIDNRRRLRSGFSP
jgi:hypothetical protein